MSQRQEDTLARLGLGPGAHGRSLLSTAASCLLQCSKTCGGGHRRRALKCEDHNHQEIHEMYCANLIRPPDVESCNDHACEVVWITGEWTEVRASINEPLPKGQKPLPLPIWSLHAGGCSSPPVFSQLWSGLPPASDLLQRGPRGE